MLQLGWLAAAASCPACAQWRPALAEARLPAACARAEQCAGHIAALRDRSAARAAGNFAEADAIRAQLLGSGVELEDTRDGDTLWRRAQHGPEVQHGGEPPGPQRRSLRELAALALLAADVDGEAARAELAGSSVAQLAQAAAAVVADAGAYYPAHPPDARRCADALAQAARVRMGRPGGARELHGRKAADAAFNFALAGIADAALFSSLADALNAELVRLGESQPRGVLLALAEKLAAAGVDGRHAAFATVARSLAAARPEAAEAAEGTAAVLLRGLHGCGRPLELFDSRPLLWLGRHARRQPKRTAPDAHLATAAALRPEQLAAAALGAGGMPVLVDLGCGFGVCPLGLAAHAASEAGAAGRGDAAAPRSPVDDFLRAQPLLVGCDLNGAAVAYAAAIALRLGLGSRVAFAGLSAMEGLQWAAAAAEGGSAPLGVLVNFPTPFSWQPDEQGGAEQPAARGNGQLPTREDGFMAGEQLLSAAVEAVAATGGRSGGAAASFLYLSTNVEDVAVHMRAQVEAAARGRLRALSQAELLRPAADGDGASAARVGAPPLRQAKYAQRGGARAAGCGWLEASPFPRRARTETEALCELEGKPVFRCLFVPTDGAS